MSDAESPEGGSTLRAQLRRLRDALRSQAPGGVPGSADAGFEALFDFAPDAMLVASPEGTILLTNRACDELFGHAPGSLQGEPVERLVPKRFGQHRAYRAAYLHNLTPRQMRAGEALCGLRGDGAEVPLDIHLSPVMTSEGTVVIAALRDLTDRLAQEEQQQRLRRRLEHAKQVERMGALAGGVAHDLNNLLHTVLGSAEAVLASAGVPADVQECAREIVDAARRAASLGGHLLAYSGRGRVVVSPVAVAPLVKRLLPQLEAAVSAQGRLLVDADRVGEALADSDAEQLTQVINHLVANAAEAVGGEGGEVLVRVAYAHFDAAGLAALTLPGTALPGGFITLEVSDDGEGIQPERFARIFDPFFSTRSSQRGLGLAVVSGIVRSHGGALHIDSEVGRGTRALVLLPASRSSSQQLPVQNPSKRAPRSGSVLVVDDEAPVRRTVERMLRRMGLGSLSAENGRVGLEVFEAHREEIVAVLLDVSMPVLGGVETLQRLRKVAPELPVILSSGYNDSESVVHGEHDRALRFLQKPYTLSELTDVLDRMLG